MSFLVELIRILKQITKEFPQKTNIKNKCKQNYSQKQLVDAKLFSLSLIDRRASADESLNLKIIIPINGLLIYSFY